MIKITELVIYYQKLNTYSKIVQPESAKPLFEMKYQNPKTGSLPDEFLEAFRDG